MSGLPIIQQRAFVARLNLTQFRNHARLDLYTEGGPVCLVGPNGAGKTNILEARVTFGARAGLARGGP